MQLDSKRAPCLCSGTCYSILRQILLGIFFTAIVCVVISSLTIIFPMNLMQNNDYAAKTLHMHKVTTAAPIPQRWDSLGSMHSGSIAKQVFTYFVYEKDAMTDSEDQIARNNAFGNTFYVNDVSLSILSDISPTIYTATLIFVCTLSAVNFIAEMLEENDFCCLTKTCFAAIRKQWFFYLLAVVYGLWALFTFVTPGIERKTEWGEETPKLIVHFAVSSHLPSLVYCVILAGTYYLHLTRKRPSDSYWQYLIDTGKRDRIVPDPEGLGCEMKQHSFFMPPVQFNSAFQPSNVHKDTTNGKQKGTALSVQIPPLYLQKVFKSQDLSMDSGAIVMSARPGATPATPVCNETSIVVCLIVVLGGIANLGMCSAFLLETQAQLVIVCVLIFAVLEIARVHLVGFFWYLHKAANGEFYADLEMIVTFIELVVFLLQGTLLVIWQLTLSSCAVVQTDQFWLMRVSVLFPVCCFLLLRAIVVSYAVFESFKNICSAENASAATSNLSLAFAYCEVILYILSVLVILFATFLISVPVTLFFMKIAAEAELLFYENKMYVEMGNARKNCVGITNSTLMLKAQTSFESVDNVFPNTVSPVHMKVFGWTRSYTQLRDSTYDTDVCDDKLCPSADVLFCANAFEQHWGQCHDHFHKYQLPVFEPKWAAVVKNAVSYSM